MKRLEKLECEKGNGQEKSKRGWVSQEYGRGTWAKKCFKCGQEGHFATGCAFGPRRREQGNLNALSTADQVQKSAKEVQNVVSLAVNPTMSYYITVQVPDLALQLMVDTGAAVSLLRREQWSRLGGAEKHKMEQWDGGRLVGVEGSPVEVDGVGDNGHSYWVRVDIVVFGALKA